MFQIDREAREDFNLTSDEEFNGLKSLTLGRVQGERQLSALSTHFNNTIGLVQKIIILQNRLFISLDGPEGNLYSAVMRCFFFIYTSFLHLQTSKSSGGAQQALFFSSVAAMHFRGNQNRSRGQCFIEFVHRLQSQIQTRFQEPQKSFDTYKLSRNKVIVPRYFVIIIA